MTLKQARDICSDTRYEFVAHGNFGEFSFDRFSLDYLGDSDEFYNNFMKYEAYCSKKTKVTSISYNKAMQAIEIAFEVKE